MSVEQSSTWNAMGERCERYHWFSIAEGVWKCALQVSWPPNPFWPHGGSRLATGRGPTRDAAEADARARWDAVRYDEFPPLPPHDGGAA